MESLSGPSTAHGPLPVRFWMSAAGLAVIAVSLASGGCSRSQPPSPGKSVYETGHDEVRTDQLADGRRLVLDRASRVSVNQTYEGEVLRLEQGRARIEVRRPAVIEAGDARIDAANGLVDLGFTPDGGVDVTARTARVELTTPRIGATVRLQPGERLVWDRSGLPAQAKPSAEDWTRSAP
ncbi:FecR domain-containing protein [Caulobacter endophyticus]|nr:FecR domain-containing protein [Caulobacter endophyticus]